MHECEYRVILYY